MQRALTVFAVAALLGVVGLVIAGGAAAAPLDGEVSQMDVDPDDVSIAVALAPDGDAVWTVEYRVRLATDEEKDAFAELRTDVENDTAAYASRFTERMNATASTAETATGREMSVSNATVTAQRRELPRAYGVVTYRFEWANFAAVDGDRLRVGDAIDGLFLDDSSSLAVSWPDGYRLAETTPEPDAVRDRSVVWNGPVDFSAGQPRVAIAQTGPLSGLTAGELAAAIVGLLVVGGGAVAYRRRHRGGTLGDAAPAAADGDELDAGSDGAADGDGAGVDPDATDEAAASDATASASDTADPVDEELLSNEEQVLRLIESSGGRMKQKRVADELDWTAAKTSQVVTGLRDEGELDGFRLGRENVLSLPDHDATGADAEEGGSGSDPDDDA